MRFSLSLNGYGFELRGVWAFLAWTYLSIAAYGGGRQLIDDILNLIQRGGR